MNFSADLNRPGGRDTVFLSAGALLLFGLAACFATLHMGSYAAASLCLSGGCALLAALETLVHRWQLHSAGARDARATLQAQTLALAEASTDALLFLQPIADAEGEVQGFRVTHANGQASAMMTSLGALSGLDLGAALPFLATPGTLQQYRGVLRTSQPRTVEVAVDEPRLDVTWLRVSASRFAQGLVLRLEDQTAARAMERQLCHQVQHDTLTGLPNRTLLDDRIQQSLKRARRNNGASAVLLLDLDKFSRVNDTYGRAAGDHVLRTVAQRLLDAVRSTDSVLRLAGDEFVIVFDDIPTHGPVTDFARKIVLSMFAPVLWNGHELHITASIGVAMYPSAGTTPETLLIQADIEMNRRKRAEFAALPVVRGAMTPTYGAFSLSLS